MTRRHLLFLSGSALAGLPALADSGPENLSYPLRSLDGTLTPPKRFFVRDHFEPPSPLLETWQLRIEGRVEHPYRLDYSDLVELPSAKLEAVLECAGNAAGGSAVSNAVWEGVPIAELLARAKPLGDATALLFEGADAGVLMPGTQPGPYSQLLPLSKCLEPSSLIAYKLNETVLPAKNGFPARALFPGWYGMDSVKWLRRVVVLGPEDRATAFQASGMDRLYNRVTPAAGKDQVTRLSALQVKSAIAWPGKDVRLPAARHLVWGFAWTGTGAIDKVLLTTDNGKTWTPAHLEPARNGFGWVRWTYSWNAKPGDYILMSRASDRAGHEQPLHRDPARKDAYELNWCAPLTCHVR